MDAREGQLQAKAVARINPSLLDCVAPDAFVVHWETRGSSLGNEGSECYLTLRNDPYLTDGVTVNEEYYKFFESLYRKLLPGKDATRLVIVSVQRNKKVR